MSTFISVIVPVYNIEQYLRRCIDSVLAQTYRNFELILVDDGSTDSSGVICDEYANGDFRVRVFHKENGGSSSARNLALAQAKGEYISFVDSDDYVERDFLEKLLAPVDDARDKREMVPLIVQVGRDEIDENGDLLKSICIPPKEEIEISAKDFFASLIMHEGDCSFCTKLISRTLFEGREFPIGKLNEDFRLLIEMLPQAGHVVSLPYIGYHVFYRIGSNSRKKSKSDFSRVFKDSVDNADFVENIVDKKYPDLREVAVRFALFQRLEYLLHIPIELMNRDYAGYKEVVSYIRKHFPSFLWNRFLTIKNKLYLILFVFSPKGIRQLHAKLKRL